MRISSNVWRALALAGVFAVLVLARPLLPVDETRYLDVAWEMHLSGDPFHLTRNFDLYTHKPPLLFWLINLVWMLTGMAEFPARMVAPLIGVVSVASAARLARQLWPDDPGIDRRVWIILSSLSVFLIYASAKMFDTMLMLASVLGVGLIWRIGQGDHRVRNWALIGLVLGAGVLAKGPVIFVHILPAVVLMPLWATRRPGATAFALGLTVSFLITAAVVALWLVPALWTGSPEYREELLWRQTADRVAGGMAHDRPVWFFLATLPILLFPWGWSPRMWRAIGGLRHDNASRLLMIWAAAALVIFSVISSKQAHYLLPELGAFALLVARAWGQTEAGRNPAPLGLLAVSLVGFAAAFGAIKTHQPDLLTPEWAFVAFGIVCLSVATLSWRMGGLRGMAVSGLGLVLAAHGLILGSRLYPAYDPKPVAARMAAHDGPIAVAGIDYNAEFNFSARLTRPVEVLRAPDAKDWLSQHPDGMLVGPMKKMSIEAAPQDRIWFDQIEFGLWRGDVVSARVSGPAG
ncbi:4-amino-4-deoxy-L-arabinose transferase-like glycosyltransferase [Albidovulum inexpectatum]|uniref:4-amino-4-deoxy-L-arabinose transferase-like glycosyltransferase n=1 Tax=Albidovulum inexpectatum TaxID=196587 RepID=A0A2S5JJ58_9RHOB|nr:glycosyltransferase family 39 protein [Albidovulum inexpectatum]PPB81509.1 4-amino-4-deoxy-L-arabinose transferase-like glycosyltransferase [Albidovulum inexpectatum]